MNEENIIKPVTLVKEDFTKGVIDLINQTSLPFFIIESILKDFLNDIHVASQKQLEADREAYQNQLDKIAGKDKNEE